jgi:hypothetical protein
VLFLVCNLRLSQLLYACTISSRLVSLPSLSACNRCTVKYIYVLMTAPAISSFRYLQRLYKVKYPVAGPLLLKRSCVRVLTGQWSNGTTVSACSQWAPLTCLVS